MVTFERAIGNKGHSHVVTKNDIEFTDEVLY